MTAPERPGWVPTRLYPFADRYVEIDGSAVHYVDEGAGPTLLLLHGNPTWSFLYREIIIGLRSEYRCVALDYPGFGLSVAGPGYRFTPAEHAEVVAQVVERLALTDVTMMVQDWGGPMAHQGLCVPQARAHPLGKLVPDTSHRAARRRRTQHAGRCRRGDRDSHQGFRTALAAIAPTTGPSAWAYSIVTWLSSR